MCVPLHTISGKCGAPHACHAARACRFLTLLALRAFADARLDAVVLEVGLGGRLDATNVVPAPVATAVTTLDYDHTELLGDTLAQIATEKAGIFRRGVPAVTCTQATEAAAALRHCAGEVCALAAGLCTCCHASVEVALFWRRVCARHWADWKAHWLLCRTRARSA